jgi:hypothetical protein
MNVKYYDRCVLYVIDHKQYLKKMHTITLTIKLMTTIRKVFEAVNYCLPKYDYKTYYDGT